jgi:hypothetical protein
MPTGNVVLLSSARGASAVKMATTQEKAFCVVQHAKTNFVRNVQRKFRKHCQKGPPQYKCIEEQCTQFENKGEEFR